MMPLARLSLLAGGRGACRLASLAAAGRLRRSPDAHVLAREGLDDEGHLVELLGHLLADIEKGLAVLHLLLHLVDALKLHHFQSTQRLLRPLRVEEAQAVQLPARSFCSMREKGFFFWALIFRSKMGLR